MKRFFALALITLTAACGGGGGGDDDPDLIDAAADDPDAAPRACFADASYGAATIGNQAAESQGAAAAPEFAAGGGTLNAAEPFDIFQLELYGGIGPFAGGGITTGTFDLTGPELNYATCAVCPRIFTDCTQTACNDQQFYVTGGSVTVTQLTPNLQFTVSNLQFVEVTIAPAPDFTSTPVAGGCSTSVTSASFDALVTNTPS